MSDNTLKRTMKLHHLVIFGVAFLTPMIAYTIYGVIATASHGVESGSICFAGNRYDVHSAELRPYGQGFPCCRLTHIHTQEKLSTPSSELSQDGSSCWGMYSSLWQYGSSAHHISALLFLLFLHGYGSSASSLLHHLSISSVWK